MKAIVNTAPGCLEMCELPTPEPGPGQIRIRTSACGICATDLDMIAGWERTSPPATPGHEWAGVVDAVGPQVNVAMEGRTCVAENILADGGEVGFEHPGGYAQFFLTEADNVHFIPRGFPAVHATLIEPLAVCVHGIRRLRADAAGPAVVFGDGPIGLLAVRLLSRAGIPEIILAGGRSGRLALGRAFGATETLDYHEQASGLASALVEAASKGFRTVIEATGTEEAIQAAFKVAAPGARVLVLGDYGKARAAFAWNDLLHKELELIGSNASANAWPEAVRLALSNDIDLASLVSHCLPAARFEEAIALAQGGEDGVVKVVMDWTDASI